MRTLCLFLASVLLVLCSCSGGEEKAEVQVSKEKLMLDAASTLNVSLNSLQGAAPGTERVNDIFGQQVVMVVGEDKLIYFKSQYGTAHATDITVGGNTVQCVISRVVVDCQPK